LRHDYDVEVEWRAFELHPGIPREGQLIPWSPDRIARGRSHFEELAREAGLEVGPRTHWYNSDLAHEANVWAQDRGHGEALHREIYRAYFIRDENIGSVEVLAAIAANLGLDADDLRRALEDRRYREQVRQEYEEAREVGVTAVPTFVADGYAIVGAHPYETFRRLMDALGQAPRPAQ
jgi:predicted DsbA family dithiol-disulfide isomerase